MHLVRPVRGSAREGLATLTDMTVERLCPYAVNVFAAMSALAAEV